jgi:hypothetical protein
MRVNFQSNELILIIPLLPRKDNIEKTISDKNKEINVVEKVSFFDSTLNNLDTIAYTKKPGSI